MLENIIFILLTAVMAAAGLCVWRLEFHGPKTDREKLSDEKENKL